VLKLDCTKGSRTLIIMGERGVLNHDLRHRLITRLNCNGVTSLIYNKRIPVTFHAQAGFEKFHLFYSKWLSV